MEFGTLVVPKRERAAADVAFAEARADARVDARLAHDLGRRLRVPGAGGGKTKTIVNPSMDAYEESIDELSRDVIARR